MGSIFYAIFLYNAMFPWVPILLILVSLAFYLILKFVRRDPMAEKKFAICLGSLLGVWMLFICAWFLSRFKM